MLHLKRAESTGWIKKTIRGISGQGWRRHSYTASIPSGVVTQSDHVNSDGGNAELPPIREGGNGKEPPKGERGNFGDTNVVTQGDPSTSISSTRKNNSTRRAAVDEVYRFYVETISPSRRSSKRAKLNISTHLKTHQPESLRQAVINYSTTALKSDSQYRKDPANFFGRNEPYFLDYLSENFNPPSNQNPDIDQPREVELESLYAN
jgi:hypothetical protein